MAYADVLLVDLQGEEVTRTVTRPDGTKIEITTTIPVESRRPLTQDEVADRDALAAGAAAAATAAAAADANASTLTGKVGQAIAQLESAGQNWASLTAAQKDAAMKLTVQMTARLARLALRRLDTAP